MASSHKIITLCLCLIVASFGVLVEGGGGMMGGLLGGGGKHGQGTGALETLLAAGLLAQLLRRGGGGGFGGFGLGRAAAVPEAQAAPFGFQPGFGF